MSSLTYSLVAVVALLAANAFFVAAEFALVKVRGYQLDQAVGQRRRAAILSARMHKNLDAYLAACQLGITMASLGLGWVGEPAVAALLEPLLAKVGITGPALHTISFIVGFLVFSSLHIVVGEQVPKTYAIRKPTPVTLALAYPLQWFYWLVFPLNWLLDRANAAILRLLGVRGGPHHEVISEDEISAIVNESEAHGELEQSTAEIIRKAFLFDDQTVREVMVPWVNVDKLRLTSDVHTNKEIVVKTQHSRFPVLDSKGNVVGVLATKDLTAAFVAEEQNVWATLSDRLRAPMVVPPTLLISLLLERMRSTRTHMAIIVDEHGTYIGIVTLEDMLEEIVGEIEDEWDVDETVEPIEAVESGWRASGQLPIAMLEETVGIDIDRHTQIGTLGGFVMQLLERLPKEGDSITYGGFKFYVAQMDGRQVKTVLISPSGKRRGKTADAPEEEAS
ncbi:MAG: hemolysin family protein [Gammaproteobacteria bacterium]|nr:hemolysin family protein [Gammaproteobacteria bacterium]NNC57889.1 HlyC/CorC family transporter [Woeseiaceae bacterium]